MNHQKNLNFIKTKLSLALKENKEYKINFWSLFIVDFFIFFSFGSFYYIYSTNLSYEFLDFNFVDFFFFLICSLTTMKLESIFSLSFFDTKLIKADLNQILTKPINSFINTNFLQLSGGWFFLYLLNWIFIIIFGLINYKFYNLLFALIILILGQIFFIIFLNYLWSFSFWIKNMNFIQNFYNIVDRTNRTYTPKVLENSKIGNIFYILPSSLFGYFVTLTIKGNYQILNYLKLYIFLIILFSFLLLNNWKKGIKIYEGFN